MKIVIFCVGIILSLWMSLTVYTPVKGWVDDIQKVYVSSQVAIKKTGTTLEKVTDSTAYQEMARIFGIKVANESTKKDNTTSSLNSLFEHNIALWIATGAGFLTFSLYMNIISMIMFFMKPITFFIKK